MVTMALVPNQTSANKKSTLTPPRMARAIILQPSRSLSMAGSDCRIANQQKLLLWMIQLKSVMEKRCLGSLAILTIR
jgi:hypothetical protein